MKHYFDERIKEFATARQLEILEAIECEGSPSKAARKLGLHPSGVYRVVENVDKKAKIRGYDPEYDMTKPTGDGYIVKGTSTLYSFKDDETGEKRLQWVKTNVAIDRQLELLSEAAAALSSELKPIKKVKSPVQKLKENLLNTFIITDYHLGAMAWEEEAGAHWDMETAENLLVDWFSAAIQMSPNAHTAIFAQLGDFIHFDSLEAVTPTSKHIVDPSARYGLIVRVAIRVVRRIIHMLLEKHEKVIVLMAEGNHDISGSIWLREMLEVMYSEEPRVEVITRPDPYYSVEHGDTSIFFHHGHKKKMKELDRVFAAKFREIYGRTKHSYGHVGHLHHDLLVESNLMKIEQHRTLASPDSHASRGGWISGRDAKVITYDKSFGEVGRITVSPEMVKCYLQEAA